MERKSLFLVLICIFIIFIGSLILFKSRVISTNVNVSTEYIKINNAPDYVKSWMSGLNNKSGIYLSKNGSEEYYFYANNTRVISLSHELDNNGELKITISLEAYEKGINNDTYFKFIFLNRKPKYIIVNNIKYLYNDIQQIK